MRTLRSLTARGVLQPPFVTDRAQKLPKVELRQRALGRVL